MECAFAPLRKPSFVPGVLSHCPSVTIILFVIAAFSEGMANNGYEDIVNIDISSVVIEAMQKKYSNSSKLTYITMDVRNMSAFQTGSFDAIIDKGTLDSILVSMILRQPYLN
ncbi:hypothetical protein KSS87_017255 [Heliosperma pusillum]|nr:hypothetical protein KSS87_017255 [Heliosperma pusillum]